MQHRLTDLWLFYPIFLCKIWFIKSTFPLIKFTQKICFHSLRKLKSICQNTFAAFPFLLFKSSASEGSTLHTDFILISRGISVTHHKARKFALGVEKKLL